MFFDRSRKRVQRSEHARRKMQLVHITGFLPSIASHAKWSRSEMHRLEGGEREGGNSTFESPVIMACTFFFFFQVWRHVMSSWRRRGEGKGGRGGTITSLCTRLVVLRRERGAWRAMCMHTLRPPPPLSLPLLSTNAMRPHKRGGGGE